MTMTNTGFRDDDSSSKNCFKNREKGLVHAFIEIGFIKTRDLKCKSFF